MCHTGHSLTIIDLKAHLILTHFLQQGTPTLRRPHLIVPVPIGHSYSNPHSGLEIDLKILSYVPETNGEWPLAKRTAYVKHREWERTFLSFYFIYLYLWRQGFAVWLRLMWNSLSYGTSLLGARITHKFAPSNLTGKWLLQGTEFWSRKE